VKDQYFGDINDYRKYGLLRCFVEAGFAPGVCWMLTPDGASNDGQKTGYLQQPGRWRGFDPELFDFLATCVMNGARAVRHIEHSALLSKTRYYSDLLGDGAASRATHMTSALRSLSPSDLLFFDPDNGLEVKSVPYGSRGSSKYIYWDEVQQAWKTGASLLIFQHFNREPRLALVGRLSDELAKRTGSPLVAAIHTAHVLFLFAGQSRHRGAFEPAAKLIADRWTGQATIEIQHTA